MRKALIILTLLALLIPFAGSTNAQQIDWNANIPSTYLWMNGATPTVIPNVPIIVEIQAGNSTGNLVYGFSGTWHVYGTADVKTGNWINAGGVGGGGSIVLTNGFDATSIWSMMNYVTTWSWNGVLPDTLNHTTLSYAGWPTGSPLQTHYELHLSVPLNPGEQGQLCVDSIDHWDPAYDWMFAHKSWFGGPYCWPVSIKLKKSQNILATPVNLPIQHHINYYQTYIISDPDGDPVTGVGAIDQYGNPLGTATLDYNLGVYSIIWEYDPPCNWVGQSNQVRLYAEDADNFYPNVNLYDIDLTILNSAPTISGACGNILNVIANASGSASFTATDPNISSPDEALLFAIKAVSPSPSGMAFIDPNGNFVFDPIGTDVNQTFVFTISVTDCAGDYSECDVTFEVTTCGDVNNDDLANILDIVYIINYKYKDGPAPDPLNAGEVDGTPPINILDIVYLINNIYKDGPDLNCP